MLRKNCRCVAPDLIGSGLSDKPVDWDYLPASHAQNIETFLSSLTFEKCTFVLSDWGGPIGLSNALKHPEKIQQVLLLNTCYKLVDSNLFYSYQNHFIGTTAGQLLNSYVPCFSSKVVKRLIGNSLAQDKLIYRHYCKPLEGHKNKKSYTVFTGHLSDSGAWLEMIWNQFHKLQTYSITIIWGMKDGFLKTEILNRLQSGLPHAKVIRLEKAGHLSHETAPQIIIKELGFCKKLLKYELIPGGVWNEK